VSFTAEGLGISACEKRVSGIKIAPRHKAEEVFKNSLLVIIFVCPCKINSPF
jgi:hypothetical protein